MFLVLEGLTGSGKSTLARHLEDSGWARVSPPGDGFNDARRLLDDDPDNLEARHLFFAMGTAHVGAEVGRLRTEGRNVVADSWSFRTNATHVALGSRLGPIDMHWLPKPDLVVFLDCPESIRRLRRLDRGSQDSYWKARCDAVSEEIRDYYLNEVPGIRTVDASQEPSALIATVTAMLP